MKTIFKLIVASLVIFLGAASVANASDLSATKMTSGNSILIAAQFTGNPSRDEHRKLEQLKLRHPNFYNRIQNNPGALNPQARVIIQKIHH